MDKIDNNIKIMAANALLIKALGEAYPDGPDETLWEVLGCFISVICQKAASGDVTFELVLNTITTIATEYNEIANVVEL